MGNDEDNAWGSIGMDDALIDASGTTTLDNVPFAIAKSGNNFWHSYIPGPGANSNSPKDDNQTRVLSIPVSIKDATTAYTLINSYWGTDGPASYALVEFFATGGVYQSFDLIGDEDIRDFNQSSWTNQSPNTVQVAQWTGWLNNPSQRIDRQQYDLSSAFLGQTLTEIRITDNGGFDRLDATLNQNIRQRVFVAGVTVASIPEPTTLVLLLLGSLWSRPRR